MPVGVCVCLTFRWPHHPPPSLLEAITLINRLRRTTSEQDSAAEGKEIRVIVNGSNNKLVAGIELTWHTDT